MTDQSNVDDQLKHPKHVRGADGTRADGRPTDPARPIETKRPAGDVPTVAPEEEGHKPTTEHAPGGDL
jgi:hypothetical protein